VNRPLFCRPLLALALLAWAGLLRAADPASPPAANPPPANPPPPAKTPATPPPAAPKAVNTEVLVLPTVQVTATRIKQIDKELEKLDKLIAREKGNVKPGELDKALNSPKLSTAAAIFGGNSSEHLSEMAASRVSILEAERSILEDMKRPASLDDLKQLETELDQLKTTMRDLDNIERDGPPARQ